MADGTDQPHPGEIAPTWRRDMHLLSATHTLGIISLLSLSLGAVLERCNVRTPPLALLPICMSALVFPRSEGGAEVAHPTRPRMLSGDLDSYLRPIRSACVSRLTTPLGLVLVRVSQRNSDQCRNWLLDCILHADVQVRSAPPILGEPQH